jgi:hypothetical protein
MKQANSKEMESTSHHSEPKIEPNLTENLKKKRAMSM